MSRFAFVLPLFALTLAACDEPIGPMGDADLEDAWRSAANAAVAPHGGSTDCGEQNVDAYSNESGDDQCVHATFTNNCDSDMDIEPGDDGDTVYVDPGKSKTFSWTIPSGQGIELDCDGSCEEEDCDGCVWELSFGGTCADATSMEAGVRLARPRENAPPAGPTFATIGRR